MLSFHASALNDHVYVLLMYRHYRKVFVENDSDVSYAAHSVWCNPGIVYSMPLNVSPSSVSVSHQLQLVQSVWCVRSVCSPVIFDWPTNNKPVLSPNAICQRIQFGLLSLPKEQAERHLIALSPSSVEQIATCGHVRRGMEC